MRWLKRGAIALCALAVVALAGIAAVFWAVGTNSGTAWLIERLVAAAPPLLIERVRGTLLAGLRPEGVGKSHDNDSVNISSLSLESKCRQRY